MGNESATAGIPLFKRPTPNRLAADNYLERQLRIVDAGQPMGRCIELDPECFAMAHRALNLPKEIFMNRNSFISAKTLPDSKRT